MNHPVTCMKNEGMSLFKPRLLKTKEKKERVAVGKLGCRLIKLA
jgi:hypothetical protein